VVWRSDPGRVVPDFQFVLVHMPLPSPLSAPPNSYTVAVCLMHPASVGSLRLASADPDAAPLIDPNHLGDEADLDALLLGIDHARELGEASAFAPWRAREVLPGAEVRDVAALRTFARQGVLSYFHPVGTCRMGTDRMAVVDPELRVRGVEGLRVADASIMPSLVTANTNAASMMIGEKAADLVRGLDAMHGGGAAAPPARRLVGI
jgi:choline dehydrogenase